MLDESIKAYASAAVTVLSGRDDVELHFVSEDEQNDIDFPQGRRAYAEKSADGKPAIYIRDFVNSVWNAEQFIKTLAHESAHVRLHWDYLIGGKPINNDNAAREREAESFAQKWSNYAMLSGESYYPGFPPSRDQYCPLPIKFLRPLHALAERVNYDDTQWG